ncbi:MULTISPECIES: VENN motif pre-toxin domain-containing protein [unclassified Serratia (in: enterobacteria)]|uniref:VENN motif pre-toxin domain-containing protein n=1 Tax=unclassified Serratia (in: enterobacteria) TaxID=2647522 RepID=UPI002ED23BC9|nr:VENN motif pre-toxin domain-containing protein [Serratia sp. C2(2)]MEE4448675.1 VENN motif pre-toxin domain-containing protein [Serratia sp. C2(1)]
MVVWKGAGKDATADKNKLDTGTLGFKDIHNQADFEVEHQSVGISSGGSIGSQFAGNMANGLLVGANNSGHDSSTTHAAVSDGTIVIRDQDKQTQNVSDLSRDVEHANQTLSPIFDKEKEQKRLQQAQLIGEIGNQAMDIARTEGDIRSINAGKAELEKNGIKEPGRDATKEQWKAYNEKQHATDSYKMTQKQWGTGSSVQQGMQAATAAIQGLAGGNIAKTIAGGAAPYLAEVIHTQTTDLKTGKVNVEANLMAHAVLGAVVAQASGNSALAGASGAVMGEYIAQQMYPNVDRKDLTEEQKQTISALGTLAAGLAGGIASGDTAGAVAGAQAGKNSLENNELSLPGGMSSYGMAATTLAEKMIKDGKSAAEISAALNKNARGDLPEGANITKVIVNGYKDGVLIAGAAYLGPAASIGKVVAGAAIAEIANGSYQWFDINSEKNLSLPESQQKTWDYKGSISAGITGALAPGRGLWQNVGMAAGGAAFSDGPDVGSVGIAAGGAGLGWGFSKYAPGVVNSITGKEAPGLVFDTIGSLGTEFLGGYTKELLKTPDPKNTPEKEKEGKK